MCNGLTSSSFAMACKCCCFMQPLAQLFPRAFAPRDARPRAALPWDTKGRGNSVAKPNPSLPWSQGGPASTGRSSGQSVLGMGGQHSSGDTEHRQCSYCSQGQCKAACCLCVCLSVCVLPPAELTAWLVSLRTRRVL